MNRAITNAERAFLHKLLPPPDNDNQQDYHNHTMQVYKLGQCLISLTDAGIDVKGLHDALEHIKLAAIDSNEQSLRRVIKANCRALGI